LAGLNVPTFDGHPKRAILPEEVFDGIRKNAQEIDAEIQARSVRQAALSESPRRRWRGDWAYALTSYARGGSSSRRRRWRASPSLIDPPLRILSSCVVRTLGRSCGVTPLRCRYTARQSITYRSAIHAVADYGPSFIPLADVRRNVCCPQTHQSQIGQERMVGSSVENPRYRSFKCTGLPW